MTLSSNEARIADKLLKEPITILGSSFGLGLSWGTMLFCLLSLCFIACETDEVDAQCPSVIPPVVDEHRQVHPVLTKAELKVLDIGNSYTSDATNLLPLIVEATGVEMSDLCLYKAIRGNASLKSWCDIYNNLDNNYTYSISKVIGDLAANVQTGTGNKGDGSLFRSALTSEEWDLIIIHQLSTLAPYYDKWAGAESDGSLDELLNIIKTNQPNAVIGFYIIHSYWDNYTKNTEHSSYERWNLICESVQKLQSNYDIDFIIPYGTAIENLRASSLNNEYDLTRDGTHCDYGLSRYTAACCYYETLIYPRTGISVLGNTARYTSDSNTQYPNINVTDENANLAQQAAILATQNPFTCINPEELMEAPSQ